MASYEVQAKSKLDWQIVAVFDGYERAYECAVQLEHDRIYDELRVTREVEDPKSGRFRARVLYQGGEKVRHEIAREEAENEKQAAVEKRQQRLDREIIPRWIRKSDKERARRESRGNPLWIAVWTTFLFSAGMIAVYFFEIVLFDK